MARASKEIGAAAVEGEGGADAATQAGPEFGRVLLARNGADMAWRSGWMVQERTPLEVQHATGEAGAGRWRL